MPEMWRRRHGARMVREVVLTMPEEWRGCPAVRRSLVAALARCAAVALAAALAVACTPSDPLNVTAIQTGTSLNSDDSVATHSTTFRPTDTMYVSVLTSARGSGTIVVRWSYGSSVLHELTRDVAYSGPAATDFRFQAADGFPPGDYSVEVLLDGQPVGARRLRVQ